MQNAVTEKNSPQEFPRICCNHSYIIEWFSNLKCNDFEKNGSGNNNQSLRMSCRWPRPCTHLPTLGRSCLAVKTAMYTSVKKVAGNWPCTLWRAECLANPPAPYKSPRSGAPANSIFRVQKIGISLSGPVFGYLVQFFPPSFGNCILVNFNKFKSSLVNFSQLESI